MYDILQFTGGIILAFGYIVKIVQIVSTRSARGACLRGYLLLLAGVALMEIYAIDLARRGVGLMFLVTNTISLTVLLILCYLVYTMQKHEKLG